MENVPNADNKALEEYIYRHFSYLYSKLGNVAASLNNTNRVVNAIPRTSPLYILINDNGLVANNANDESGRGNYFPPEGGTTESQFLLIQGVADIYAATTNVDYYRLMNFLLKPINSMFGGKPFAAWLFCVKAAFNSCAIHYDRMFTFTSGVGTIGSTFGGGITRTVFRVLSYDAELLWENPYSKLTVGVDYSVASINTTEFTTTINLTDTGFNGVALVIYSTIDGELISKNKQFEAWPDWRPLEQSEQNVALDSIAWSMHMFTSLANAGVTNFSSIFNLVKANTEIVYTVDDGRSWIKRRTVHPLQVDGSYSYSEVDGLVIDLNIDGRAIFSMPVVPSSGGFNSEVQYGIAVSDIVKAADSIKVVINSDRAITLDVFIDDLATYDPLHRFIPPVSLSVGDNSLTVPMSSFVNSSSTPISVGATIFNVGYRVLHTDLTSVSPFKLLVSDIRPVPEEAVSSYMPGICPFTANFLNGELISWRGPIYTGYQDPGVWDFITGKESNAALVLTYLKDARTAYTSTHVGVSGPFAPVYVLDRYDSIDYGTKNQFVWAGPDPNVGWEGYQYRPLFYTAKYLNDHVTNTDALDIVDTFLTYLDTVTDSTLGVPSNYYETTAPQKEYFTPHGCFLVLGACIYYELAGFSSAACTSLKSKIATVLEANFKNGTWTMPNWYGFWSGVALQVLALIKANSLSIFTASKVDTFIADHIEFLRKYSETKW